MLDNPRNDQTQSNQDYNDQGTLGGEAEIKNQRENETSDDMSSEE